MSRKIIFTAEQQQYIKENYLKTARKNISEYLGCDSSVVKRFMNANNMVVPKEISNAFRIQAMIGKTSFTAKEDAFIIEHYLTMPIKAIARRIGRGHTGIELRLKRLGLIIPREIIEQRKKDSQFSVGSVPYSKGKKQADYMSKESIEKTKATRFKKGQKPHNENYNGHERITQDGYVEVRIKKGVYKLKHLHRWERKNGKIKKGNCLRSTDGNKLNTAPENWRQITRAENMRLNSLNQYPEDLKKTIKLKNKLLKKIKENAQR